MKSNEVKVWLAQSQENIPFELDFYTPFKEMAARAARPEEGTHMVYQPLSGECSEHDTASEAIPVPTSVVEEQSSSDSSAKYRRGRRHKTNTDHYEYRGKRKKEDSKKRHVDRQKQEARRQGEDVKRRGIKSCHTSYFKPRRLTFSKNNGLFGRGKASEPVKHSALPDLAFPEKAFLNLSREWSKSNPAQLLQGHSATTKQQSHREQKIAEEQAKISEFFSVPTSRKVRRGADGRGILIDDTLCEADTTNKEHFCHPREHDSRAKEATPDRHQPFEDPRAQFSPMSNFRYAKEQAAGRNYCEDGDPLQKDTSDNVVGGRQEILQLLQSIHDQQLYEPTRIEPKAIGVSNNTAMATSRSAALDSIKTLRIGHLKRQLDELTGQVDYDRLVDALEQHLSDAVARNKILSNASPDKLRASRSRASRNMRPPAVEASETHSNCLPTNIGVTLGSDSEHETTQSCLIREDARAQDGAQEGDDITHVSESEHSRKFPAPAAGTVPNLHSPRALPDIEMTYQHQPRERKNCNNNLFPMSRYSGYGMDSLPSVRSLKLRPNSSIKFDHNQEMEQPKSPLRSFHLQSRAENNFADLNTCGQLRPLHEQGPTFDNKVWRNQAGNGSRGHAQSLPCVRPTTLSTYAHARPVEIAVPWSRQGSRQSVQSFCQSDASCNRDCISRAFSDEMPFNYNRGRNEAPFKNVFRANVDVSLRKRSHDDLQRECCCEGYLSAHSCHGHDDRPSTNAHPKAFWQPNFLY